VNKGVYVSLSVLVVVNSDKIDPQPAIAERIRSWLH